MFYSDEHSHGCEEKLWQMPRENIVQTRLSEDTSYLFLTLSHITVIDESCFIQMNVHMVVKENMADAMSNTLWYTRLSEDTSCIY